MSTATARQNQAQTRELNASEMLDRILEQPINQRHKAIDDNLQARIEKIEELLPPQMKGQGARLAKRAMLTFARTKDLQEGCPPQEFIRCVLEAAELGLAIDGKLAYVVRYKSNWQMQPSYIGLIAACRRTGRIQDIYGDVICENDHFVHSRQGATSTLEHTYSMGEPRGNVVGAYAIVRLNGGHWRYEVMDRAELDRIQNRAPSKNGPWSTDVNEMRKKTVFRRALKLYCDDPALARVIESLEQFDEEPAATPVSTRKTSRSALMDSLPAAAKATPAFTPPSAEEEAAIIQQEKGDAHEG